MATVSGEEIVELAAQAVAEGNPETVIEALKRLRADVAQRSARPRGISQRMYASARQSRLTVGWTADNGSADAQLVQSLTMLRSRSRALVRDASFAKRARTLVTNNVVGTGIPLQAQVYTTRGELNKRVNDDIERAWLQWSRADSCHTGGRLAFPSFERALLDQVFEAGEVFIRKHPRRFGRSEIPFALELVEAERLVDEFQSPTLASQMNAQIRMGIEIDNFYRPVAYWVRTRHPQESGFVGDMTGQVERVPADQMVHLAVISRWPQTRGEPWLHAAARTLNDMAGYSEAEITRARVQACLTGAIETPEDSTSFGEEEAVTPGEDPTGAVEMEVSPGVYKRLNPGEKLHPGSPSAPNPAYDAFMSAMLREIAAGIGVSFESLSRDYSKSNYSSSRLALLDDRDVWRVLQGWFLTDFRQRIHEDWLQAAVLAGAIPTISVASYALNIEQFQAVKFKPRGWSWVDPTKEVQAFKEAVTAGFTTVSDVIASTGGGRDLEDVLDEREHELELMKSQGLVFDTSPELYTAKAMPPEPAAAPAKKPDDETVDEADGEANGTAAKLFSIQR